MKTILCLFIISVCVTVSYGQANTSLSNLSNPTSINQNLLPNNDNTRNLGSSAKSWRTLFLDSVMFLKDSLFMHNRGTQNTFVGRVAGNSITTGENNAAFGYHALYINKTSSSNTAIGSLALAKNTAANNTAVGYQSLYSNTTATLNTAIGYQALYSNTTGSPNTAVGWGALYSNTTGIENTAVGQGSLYQNTIGYSNIALGRGALFSNTTGHNNTANGFKALFYNITGVQNTASGALALLSNTSGYNNTANGYSALYSNAKGSNNTATGWESLYYNAADYNSAYGSNTLTYNTSGKANTAIGYGALFQNTTGGSNTALGYEALFLNTTGAINTAIGYDALYNNRTGSYNTAIGDLALDLNTDGGSNTAIGSSSLRYNTVGFANTAAGVSALWQNTTGSYNIAIGSAALYANTTGSYNIAIGNQALYFNTTDSYNTVIGANAGYYEETGTKNTFVGAYAFPNASGYTNSSSFGFDSRNTASNQIVLGNSSVSSIIAGTGYVIYSDGRFKKNIKENVPGMEFIRMLKPVTYNYDIHGLNAKINGNISDAKKYDLDNKTSAESLATDEKAINEKEKKIYTGLVAQDVEKAAEKLKYNFSGVYHPQNDKDVYGLSYAEFIMPIIKGMQELDKKTQEIDDLKTQVQQQNQKITELTKLLHSFIQEKSVNSSSSYLSQNIPNPSNDNTIIPFQIAKGSHSAVIQIIQTGSGKVVKSIALDVNTVQVSFNTNSLAAGSYMYSLIVDGKQVDGKQMILSR